MTELYFSAALPRRPAYMPVDASPSWPAAARVAPAWRAEASADSDAEFVAMLDGYRPSGGLARAEEVMTLLECHGDLSVATLARWIVERSVISFEWQSQTWLPWFQFHRAGMTRVRGLAPVLAELSAAFDCWELAHWFVRPNSFLAGRMPVELMRCDPDAVFDASRVERFVATA
jgi:hypothetical protein